MNENECVKVVILGEPVTQLRPIFNSKTKKAVDPKKSRDYKDLVKKTARKYVGWDWEPLDEPIRVEIKTYIGITKSWSKKKKEQALANDIMPTYKKDLDNLAKTLLDGGSGVIWKDDGCIVDLKMSKRYSAVPRAEITIYKLSEVV